jgi:hypothetical protein
MTELNAVKQLTATGAPSGNIAAWSTGPWGGTATHEGVALGVGAAGLLAVVAIDHPFAGTVKVGPQALAAVVKDFAGPPPQR